MHVFMLSCIKHACFHVFSPFSAYFFPHDIIAEKGLLSVYACIACRTEDCFLKVYMQSFCRACFGHSAAVIIADTNILKQVMVKDFDAFMDRTVSIIGHTMCSMSKNII